MTREDFHVRRIVLDEVSSTNTYAKTLSLTDEWQLVTTEFQTAGRGAGSNSWESEMGRNLLFSLVMCPASLKAQHAFALSEALALAINDALAGYAGEIRIKWPNDIYCGQRKMAGILIENDLTGDFVSRSILGVGINVNQTRFVSDAPNPVSLCQIVGAEVNREELLENILRYFSQYYHMAVTDLRDALHRIYVSHLFRLDEEASYSDANGNFRATITGVEPDGRLVLTDTTGRQRRYAFKEIIYK